MNKCSLLGNVIQSIKIFLYVWILFSSVSFGQLQLQFAFPNLNFSNPVFLGNSGDGTNRIFVVEQTGIIKVFPNSSSAITAKIFLNITDRVASGGEMGLLGLAFHPDFEINGYFYVNYTANNPRRTIISRFQVTNNPDSADKSSEYQILSFNQPYSNHNGGWIGFGPSDGYLYIAAGDGGAAGDPDSNAQNITNLLGKILRVDINSVSTYSIPPTNPFFDSTGSVRKEIYAWGMRNPWRCSFDPVTGNLWAGDVGQGDWEEIDIIQNGKNYGWRCYEGNHTYNTSGCNYPEYIFPVWEYSHSEGFSVTGGYVYRGPTISELTGKYIYADYGTRKVWALTYDGINPTVNQLLLSAPSNITSLGVDEFMELYIVSSNGKIYKFNPTTGCIDINSSIGWNLFSVPFLADDMSAQSIFPNSASEIFGFNNIYYIADTLVNGKGYWVKYDGVQPLQLCGNRISFPIQVTTGWNIIGPFDEPVPVQNIISVPPNNISSPIYGFEVVYIIADTLKPGKGYWVKTNTSGTIELNPE